MADNKVCDEGGYGVGGGGVLDRPRPHAQPALLPFGCFRSDYVVTASQRPDDDPFHSLFLHHVFWPRNRLSGIVCCMSRYGDTYDDEAVL